MTFYVIRHKPTGYFLPLRSTRRGNTHSKPEKDCIPRLFKNKQSASNALHWWLSGVFVYELSEDWESSYREWELHCTPKSDRKAEDMEIIEVDLTIKANPSL